MVSFHRTPDEWNRLDFRLLRASPIALYLKPEILEEDTRWLESAGYRIHRFDAGSWCSEGDFHDSMAQLLGFPDYYGRNLNAFNDCLADLEIPDDGGVALHFRRFDAFSRKLPQVALNVLDIIADQSRNSLLFGLRLVALVQSDDPRIRFEGIGAVHAAWNPREWSYRARGIKAKGDL